MSGLEESGAMPGFSFNSVRRISANSWMMAPVVSIFQTSCRVRSPFSFRFDAVAAGSASFFPLALLGVIHRDGVHR